MSCNISKIVNVFKVYKEHILEIGFVIDEQQPKIFKLSACHFGYLRSVYCVLHAQWAQRQFTGVQDLWQSCSSQSQCTSPIPHRQRISVYQSNISSQAHAGGNGTEHVPRSALIDNSPMEGLWGILKQERYYGKRFTSKHDLAQIIHRCIRYYNKRIQRNLGIMTPMEKHAIYLVA